MIYLNKYDKIVTDRPTPGYHEAYIDTDVEVEPNLFLTSRWTSCSCGAKTQFRDLTYDGCAAAVCSEECRAEFSNHYKGLYGNQGIEPQRLSEVAGKPESEGVPQSEALLSPV